MKTVAQKINNAMRRKGFSTVKECAIKLALPYELLRKVVGENHVPKDEQLLVYASKLGIDSKDLLFTAYYQKAPQEFKEYFEENVIRETREIYNRVPILTWDQVDAFVSSTDYYLNSHVSWDYLKTNLQGKYLFGLRVKDDSMRPFFLEDELIIIDPEVHPNPGDYIVIKKYLKSEVALTQLRIFRETLILHPLNPKFDDREMTKEMRIVGKVIRKTG